MRRWQARAVQPGQDGSVQLHPLGRRAFACPFRASGWRIFYHPYVVVPRQSGVGFMRWG